MASRPDRVIAVVAIVLLVASSVIVWNVAGVREKAATDSQKAKLVDEQVTARQAANDYDGDGIADSADACPTRPETKNGFQDADGCPDVVATTGAS
ncbi:MAG: thrombospondin type 3 repeat-containing protein [Salinigranum sp.]